MTSLHIAALPFHELTRDDLFDLLVLRAEVFVVEQRCAYQDPDAIDRRATHLLIRERGLLVATARWFQDPHEPATLRFGRMAVARSHRGQGLGHQALRATLERIGARPLFLHAQSHLHRFYAAHGFSISGPEFLEDGIPHLPMRRPSTP